jgi:hypothetical protein
MKPRLYSSHFSLALNDERHIFVFGSNLAGRHGAGAALFAKHCWSAQPGVGEGLTGWCYAIPTKDSNLRSLPLDSIRRSVVVFLDYARRQPKLMFLVTAIGTGLAGYRHEDIAPMFVTAPLNCVLPAEWKSIIESSTKASTPSPAAIASRTASPSPSSP